MPAAAFDHSAARLSTILVHSLVPIASGVLTELQGETGLLVQGCQRVPQSQRLEEFNSAGAQILDIHFGFKMVYSITARILEFTGLADYFPGRALDDQSLAFLNGRQAFQFKGAGTTGKLIYTGPRQGIPAGDLPTIDFAVEHLFTDLDEENYPPTGGIFRYVELPDIAAVEVGNAFRTALLQDVFLGTAAFSTAPLQVALYDGNPASGGTQLMSIDCTAEQWLDYFQGVTEDVTIARNSSALNWTTTTGSVRSCTHVRIRRNSLVLRDIALASTLSIPAGYGVSAPAGALALQLSWPIGETGFPWTSGTPAWWLLQYALGGDRSTFINANFRVALWTADTANGGTSADPGAGGIALTEFTTTAGSANFSVSGQTATFATLTGPTNSSGASWEIGHVQVWMEPNLLVLSEPHTATVTNGNAVSLDTAPVLTLP